MSIASPSGQQRPSLVAEAGPSQTQTIFEALEVLEKKLTSLSIATFPGDHQVENVTVSDIEHVLQLSESCSEERDVSSYEKMGFMMWNCAVAIHNRSLGCEISDADLDNAALQMRMRAIALLQASCSTRLQTVLAILSFQTRTGSLCLKSSTMLQQAKSCLESAIKTIMDLQKSIEAGQGQTWRDKDWDIVREAFTNAVAGYVDLRLSEGDIEDAEKALLQCSIYGKSFGTQQTFFVKLALDAGTALHGRGRGDEALVMLQAGMTCAERARHLHEDQAPTEAKGKDEKLYQACVCMAARIQSLSDPQTAISSLLSITQPDTEALLAKVEIQTRIGVDESFASLKELIDSSTDSATSFRALDTIKKMPAGHMVALRGYRYLHTQLCAVQPGSMSGRDAWIRQCKVDWLRLATTPSEKKHDKEDHQLTNVAMERRSEDVLHILTTEAGIIGPDTQRLLFGPLFSFARNCIDQGDLNEADNMLAHASLLVPDDEPQLTAELHLNRCWVSHKRGSMEAAKEHLDQATRLNPDAEKSVAVLLMSFCLDIDRVSPSAAGPAAANCSAIAEALCKMDATTDQLITCAEESMRKGLFDTANIIYEHLVRSVDVCIPDPSSVIAELIDGTSTAQSEQRTAAAVCPAELALGLIESFTVDAPESVRRHIPPDSLPDLLIAWAQRVIEWTKAAQDQLQKEKSQEATISDEVLADEDQQMGDEVAIGNGVQHERLANARTARGHVQWLGKLADRTWNTAIEVDKAFADSVQNTDAPDTVPTNTSASVTTGSSHGTPKGSADTRANVMRVCQLMNACAKLCEAQLALSPHIDHEGSTQVAKQRDMANMVVTSGLIDTATASSPPDKLLLKEALETVDVSLHSVGHGTNEHALLLFNRVRIQAQGIDSSSIEANMETLSTISAGRRSVLEKMAHACQSSTLCDHRATAAALRTLLKSIDPLTEVDAYAKTSRRLFMILDAHGRNDEALEVAKAVEGALTSDTRGIVGDKPSLPQDELRWLVATTWNQGIFKAREENYPEAERWLATSVSLSKVAQRQGANDGVAPKLLLDLYQKVLDRI